MRSYQRSWGSSMWASAEIFASCAASMGVLPERVALKCQSNILSMDVHALRRQDFSLSREQQELHDVFAGLFDKECPSTRVRAAEPGGFDAALWELLVASGVLTMGLPESRGGDGAGLIELVLVAEQFGLRVAPVPLVDAIVAARLLAAADAPTSMVHAATSGTTTATVAFRRVGAGERQLVSAGAVAEVVLGIEDGVLVAAEADALPPPVANLAGAPLAWRTLGATGESRVELAGGVRADELLANAVLEWKLLMAAAQTGIAQGALDLAVDYVRQRHAFGVPIGTFQAISHPLVDVAIGVEGSRRLHRRAAWFCEHEPLEAASEVLMAYLYACDVANRAASTGIHAQGGLGFTLESDMQLYFRRAKGWALITGDPHDDLRALGDLLYAPSA